MLNLDDPTFKWKYYPFNELFEGRVFGLANIPATIIDSEFRIISTSGQIGMLDPFDDVKPIAISAFLKPGNYKIRTAFLRDRSDSPNTVYISLSDQPAVRWLDPAKLDVTKPHVSTAKDFYNHGIIWIGDLALLKKVEKNKDLVQRMLHESIQGSITAVYVEAPFGNVIAVKTAGDGWSNYYVGFDKSENCCAIVLTLDEGLHIAELSYDGMPQAQPKTQKEKRAFAADRKKLLYFSESYKDGACEDSIEAAHFIFCGICMGLASWEELQLTEKELKSQI